MRMSPAEAMAAAQMEITNGMAVRLAYCAHDADTGELLQYGDDLCYVHGGSVDVFPKVEHSLAGCRVGERVCIELLPEEGYGRHDPERILVRRRDELPEEACEPGVPLEACWPDGTVECFVVTEVQGDRVVLDANHPWAGRRLLFEFEVLAIRPALAAERATGRPLAPL